MMQQFNFCAKWRKWILECVSSATANVLVNGSPSGEFKLERGLRQGDPLSPFLYLLIAEGLSLLVKNAVDEKLLEVAELGSEKIKVSHLQYADDSIFITTGNLSNARAMRSILKNFELISGLKVNYGKCSIMGLNLENSRVEQMAAILSCEVGSFPFTYLGIKVGGNSKCAAEWDHLVQKVKSRIKAWEHKKLSIGGRITLLNAVLSALPIYHLSFFKAHAKTLRDFTTIFRNFIWGEGRMSGKLRG